MCLSHTLALTFVVSLSAAASAQTTAIPIVIVGLSLQSDARTGRAIDERGRVQLSPIGLVGGLGFSHALGPGALGLTAKAAWFPVVAQETNTLGQSASPISRRSASLELATLAMDWSSARGEREHRRSWLLCAGAAWSLQTPRPGSRLAPMACAGIMGRVGRYADWRAAIEVPLRPIGSTRFQLPVSLVLHPSA